MESIQRQILLLHPGDGPYAHPQSRAMLKMQAVQTGLAVSLTISGLPADRYALYLFLHDGAAIYAGDVSNAGVHQTLPGIRLKSIWGAAVIHDASHAFCLKSTGVDWTDVAARFKLIHAPRPKPQAHDATAQSEPPAVQAPVSEPQSVSVPPENTLAGANPATAIPLYMTPSYPPGAGPASGMAGNDAAVAGPLHMTPSYPPGSEAVAELDDAETQPAETPDIAPSYPPGSEPASDTKPPLDDMGEDEFVDACESCPHATRHERINPFPSVFPQSEWVKNSYPGPTGWWHYITGRIYSGSSIVAKAVGVPGEYGMAPPVWLDGFGTYLRCVTQDAHGYWLMFQDAETGEILDLGLSPRDA